MHPSTTLLALALAVTGLAAPAPETLAARADSAVLLCKNTRCTGFANEQVTLPVTYNKCENVPAAFVGQISAIAPNGDLRCSLYSGPGCTGFQPPGPFGLPIDHRVDDLGQPPYFFDDQTQSLNCTRK